MDSSPSMVKREWRPFNILRPGTGMSCFCLNILLSTYYCCTYSTIICTLYCTLYILWLFSVNISIEEYILLSYIVQITVTHSTYQTCIVYLLLVQNTFYCCTLLKATIYQLLFQNGAALEGDDISTLISDWLNP